MPKALALFSGGLDSILAIRVIQEQGIPVTALHFFSIFGCGINEQSAIADSHRSAERLGVPFLVEDFSEDLLKLVKQPVHGHGSNMNPCIDCHARMMQRAAGRMSEAGADFLISGEVLGERPMSQRRDGLRIVERDAGVEGLLLRPLSAKLLEPTIPEQKGWVDRERLHAISGRSRKPQFELARQLGVTEYPTPAGGCLLTEPGFSVRLKDLLAHNPECGLDDIRLLKIGRHFRLAPDTKLVVSRNQQENGPVENLARPGDVLLEAARFPGPLALLRGAQGEDILRTAASITLRYGKASAQLAADAVLHRFGDDARWTLQASPATESLLDELRISADSPGGGRNGRQ